MDQPGWEWPVAHRQLGSYRCGGDGAERAAVHASCRWIVAQEPERPVGRVDRSNSLHNGEPGPTRQIAHHDVAYSESLRSGNSEYPVSFIKRRSHAVIGDLITPPPSLYGANQEA